MNLYANATRDTCPDVGANRILLEGKYSISEVAFMVGMNSVVYFRACFKEEYGLAPSHYLKHLKS